MPGVRGRIFVSYRRDDIPFAAGRLSDRLEEKFPGASVFMDVDTIEPGADFAASIKDAVSSCDVLVALIGPKWLSVEDEDGRRRIDKPDDFVALEIATALNRNIPVIPILVDGATMPQRQDLPESLATLALGMQFPWIIRPFAQTLSAFFQSSSGLFREPKQRGLLHQRVLWVRQ